MRYFLTGHTGFKGSWLSLWLARQGHEVHGFALDPEPGSLFNLASVGDVLTTDIRADIRDQTALARALKTADPDVVLHLAAQSLVGESYRSPRGTIETNVLGTLNVLDAASKTNSVRAQLIITTDKVYRNAGRRLGYRESDPLGGNDTYSASKAMADLLAHAWVTSVESPPTAIARAGNVIGGGDHNTERLIPDLIRAWRRGGIATLRHPAGIRPWQHVLDCLHGYLMLVDALLDGSLNGDGVSAWNFGPDRESVASVQQVVELAAAQWDGASLWQATDVEGFREEPVLTLESEKARTQLGWQDELSLPEAIAWTIDWYRAVEAGVSARAVTLSQLDRFMEAMPAPHR